MIRAAVSSRVSALHAFDAERGDAEQAAGAEKEEREEGAQDEAEQPRLRQRAQRLDGDREAEHAEAGGDGDQHEGRLEVMGRRRELGGPL